MKGKRIWWLQPFPRDPYDYDCDWDGILAEVSGLGKVYIKGCKEGRLYVLDAMTGKPHYVIDVIDEQYQWGQITKAGTLEPWQGGVKYHLNDPFSYYDMREMNSPDNSKYCGQPCELYQMFLNGIFGTDTTYDPTTQMLYHYATALQGRVLNSSSPQVDQAASAFMTMPISNTTIVARDVATGKVNWTWFYPTSQQRAHMVVSQDLLFSGFTDGYLRFFDKSTGAKLREMNLGSDIKVGPTIGHDSDGNSMIFVMVGVGGYVAGIMPVLPGTVVGIGLSEVASGEVRTITQTTTVATTKTQTSTITSTSPPSTTTVISEVLVGMPTEITYVAVAIGIIAVIAASLLVTRKR